MSRSSTRPAPTASRSETWPAWPCGATRKRAHLVVSKVLGKHIPVDPRLVYAAARLLGDRAAATVARAGPGRASGEARGRSVRGGTAG